MRIGILMVNTDRSDFAHRHPFDGEKFARLVARARPAWECETISVIDGALPGAQDAHDGYLITGSPASVHDDLPWVAPLLDFLRAAHSAGTPMVGCCFGHQALALALGGAVGPNPHGDWVLGTSTMSVSAPAPWMRPDAPALTLFASHKEQVTALPPGAEVLGGSQECPIGAFRIDDRVFTTQCHPEMEHDFFAALVEEMAPSLSPEVLARGRSAATAPTDSALFAEWVARFFEQARAWQAAETAK